MPSPSVQLAQAVAVNVITPVSQGAGAYLSAGIDLLDYEGVVQVVQNLGVLVGAYTVPVITQSDTVGGTYSALTTSGAFGTTASALTSVTFNASSSKRFIKYGASVGTSALVSVNLTGFKKYRP